MAELLFVPVGGAVLPPGECSHSAHLQGLFKGQKGFELFKFEIKNFRIQNFHQGRLLTHEGVLIINVIKRC